MNESISNSSSEIESYKDSCYYKLSLNVRIYGIMFNIIIGTVGNTLSFIVLGRQGMRCSSTCFYLRSLAFFDLLVLYTSALPRLVCYTMKLDVHELSTLSCKLSRFATYFTTHMTAWVLVSVTCERVISVYCPLKAKRHCSMKISKIVVFSLTMFCLGLDSVLLIMLRKDKNGCGPYAKFKFFWQDIFTWLDFIVYSLVPFILLTICNFAIAVKLVVTSHNRKHLVEGTSLNVNKTLRSVAIMLTTVGFVFLAFTLPVVLLNLIAPGWKYSHNQDYKARMSLVGSACEVLMYANSAVNFILYCISGSRFRRELLKLCGCSKLQNLSGVSKHGETPVNLTPTPSRDSNGTISRDSHGHI